MLILSRHEEEAIIIRVPGQEPIVVRVMRIFGDKARIGVQAERHIVVDREEVDLIKQTEGDRQ